MLIRTADQALYAVKNAGKDQLASFRDVLRSDAVFESNPRRGEPRRRSRADGSILNEVVAATAAIDREATAERVSAPFPSSTATSTRGGVRAPRARDERDAHDRGPGRQRAVGLVELYEMRLRRFTEDEIAIAEFLTQHAERWLAEVSTQVPLPQWPPVYELPSDEPPTRGRSTR